MNDIKIFVSKRIGIDSKVPDCPIYAPVRCGAVYDGKENSVQGDDTGEHISEKRQAYGEFTVQYWIYKNTESDYVGLCHYRRYFSFSEKFYKAKKYDGMIHSAILDKKAIARYGMSDSDEIRRIISENDILIPSPVNVKFVPTPSGTKETVKEMWDAYTEFYANQKSFSQIILDYIKCEAPQYLESAEEYLAGKIHHGFNCYVMKRSLFEEMSALQFPIMEKFEESYGELEIYKKKRLTGYLGEVLNGIFIHNAITKKNVRFRELQLVFFHNTEKCKNSAWIHVKFHILQLLDGAFSLLFPRGSKRRQTLKKLMIHNPESRG